MRALLIVLMSSFLAAALVAQQPENRRSGQILESQAPPARATEVKPEDRCTVEGSVLNSKTGEPIKKAQVMLVKMGAGDTMPLTTVTDAAGHFKIANADPGRYRLTAWRSGFARPELSARQPGDVPPALTLAPKQTVKDLVVRLAPAAVITGRVSDEDGEPVVNAQVQALRYRYMRGKRQLLPAGFAASDDQGHYRMHSLTAGRYYIKVSHPDQRFMMGTVVEGTPGADESYAATYYPGVVEPAQAVPVQVREGEERRGLDFRLMPVRTVRIRGRVENPGGGRTRQVMVGLTSRQASFAGTDRSFTSARPDGSFELRGVIPGSYTLVAMLMLDRNQLSARRFLEVGNANVEGIELLLKPGADLSGHVSFEGATGKTGLDDLRVLLRGDGAEPMFGYRDGAVQADGSFTIKNIADGEYRVTFSRVPDDFYLKAARLGSADVLEKGFSITDGAAGGTLELVLSAGAGRVEGTVVNEKREAAGGATVVLVPQNRTMTDLYKSAQSDQYGRFTLSGITPGEYELFAWESVEPGAYEDPSFLEPYKDKGKRVTVGEKTQQTVELTLIPATEPDQ